ncbi:hypothetical protein D7I44_12870 [Gryllotalpicola protaetiae]|uniref:DUF5134 domain-containing protein n=2 Tax=Gryllotalpicola protaetiae TaxID=2419771 RepID=A0A387BTR2_9MICO|nr:hypothetical protein D7I44_12870 [Gryllotalpicola protaetiae]
MAVMVLGMADTMVPALRLLPAALWVALELGLAIVVAVPGSGARCCTPLAAHRALGLVVMAALTVAMTGAMADASGGRSPGMAMPGMSQGLGVAPLALAAAAAYVGWSVWRARRHGARAEMLLSAASVALMAVFVAV